MQKSAFGLRRTDDWFGRSTCGPPAASCPPLAFTDGLGVPDDWFGRSTCGPPAASCPPWHLPMDWSCNLLQQLITRTINAVLYFLEINGML